MFALSCEPGLHIWDAEGTNAQVLGHDARIPCPSPGCDETRDQVRRSTAASFAGLVAARRLVYLNLNRKGPPGKKRVGFPKYW